MDLRLSLHVLILLPCIGVWSERGESAGGLGDSSGHASTHRSSDRSYAEDGVEFAVDESASAEDKRNEVTSNEGVMSAILERYKHGSDVTAVSSKHSAHVHEHSKFSREHTDSTLSDDPFGAAQATVQETLVKVAEEVVSKTKHAAEMSAKVHTSLDAYHSKMRSLASAVHGLGVSSEKMKSKLMNELTTGEAARVAPLDIKIPTAEGDSNEHSSSVDGGSSDVAGQKIQDHVNSVTAAAESEELKKKACAEALEFATDSTDKTKHLRELCEDQEGWES